MKKGDSFTIVTTYVDDLLLTGNDNAVIADLKNDLHKAFTINDLGALKYFLGIDVSRSESGIIMNQRNFILDVLCDTQMEGCKPVSFPMKNGSKLSVDDGKLLLELEILES